MEANKTTRRDEVSRQTLEAGLVEVSRAFDPGELAYLALTSKPEGAIRDRLAWALYLDGRRVAREWRERCDLAVLDDDGEPLALIEFKATYSHSTSWGWKPALREISERLGARTAFEAMLRADAEKALRLCGDGEGYLFLAVMHRHDPVQAAMRELIAEGNRPIADRAAAERDLLSYLSPLGDVGQRIELGAGEAFGIPMAVNDWLCGPLAPVIQWQGMA